jgi:uncharacterized membrane protein YphA (DoxX/SURF4 family)
MRWAIWIVQGILAAVFLMSGLMKVFIGSEEIRTLYTDPLGYEVGFMRLIGVVEAAAALSLLAGFRWAKLALAASSILVIVMAGAAISTIVSDQGVTSAAMPFLLLVLAVFIVWSLRKTAR